MLSNLNKQQQEAVLTTEGPVMVFAGAGTGKTKTLTHRVAYMIDALGIKPYNILAITFTNKATNEMKYRLFELVGSDYRAVTISTFHSLCARILRREIPVLGYSRNFIIIDDEEQLKIINNILKENNISKDKFTAKHAQKTINYHKCFATLPQFDIGTKIMELYNTKLKELDLLDFNDLLLKVNELFANHPGVLDKYKAKYRYILVDEFQDTNLIQYQIVKRLAEENRNLFVVGDDDQSIYSFRGTNYENMNLFKSDFPEYQIFYLMQNYRSTPTILEGCNRLIANNKNREKKELFSDIDGNPSDVKIYQAYNERLEANYIVDEILSKKLKGDLFSSFAVLTRNSSLLRNIELNLMQMNIPFRIYGGISYFRRREIKDIISYFKLILNHEDVYSFTRIVNVPSRSIGQITVNKIIKIKEKHQLSLFAAIDSCKSIVNAKRYQQLTNFKNLILELTASLENLSLTELYDILLEKSGYREYVESEPETDRLENIEEFKTVLYQYDIEYDQLKQRRKLELIFDEAILAEDKTENYKEREDKVTLSTIHSAKGLEFKYVFVIGLEENVFPSSYRQLSDEEMEEERRIAYVAFTRAQKGLYLINVQKRMLYGQYFSNNPSRFLLEFQGANFDEYQYDMSKFNTEFKNEIHCDNINEFKLGDNVNHNIFGNGVIVAVQKDTVQIFFKESQQLKKIMINHPSLNKI